MPDEWSNLETNLERTELGTTDMSQCRGVNASKPFSGNELGVLDDRLACLSES